MHSLRTLMFGWLCCTVSAMALPVPTTINDFQLPGSQPNQSGTFNNPDQCDNCHGGYGEQAVEPAYNWRGSMMSQAMRDPLFLAAMAIANQDAPQSGDLCIRCHSPKGWLEGRSLPTDGSSLNANDRESVQCHFCHRTVKPTPLGVNPYPQDPSYTSGTYPADQAYLATIAQIPTVSGNGMYVVDANDVRRGPFTDDVAQHTTYYSPLHARDAAMCGTCHDVSNPAFTRQPDGSYVPNAFDQPPPSANTYELFPIERTFSEWLMSSYNSPEGVYAPEFGGNLDTVRTCQDCHMKDVTGHGCSRTNAPLRDNLPLHDMTGGNTVIPIWVAQQFPAEVNASALLSGIERARYMLQNAASLELTVDTSQGYPELNVRVTNETGHKLPSGYPEGRRIWLNVKAYDADSMLIYESGAYDSITAVLTHDEDVKVYHIEPGVSTALAPVVDLEPGPSFHFVVNDTIYYDNRIPPRGFTNANYSNIQSPPVGYAYADGQYWDDTDYELPLTAAYAVVTLLYQTTSKEFVEFLQAANTTDNSGDTAYNLWSANGKSRPEVMRTQTIEVPAIPQTPPPAVSDLTILLLSVVGDSLNFRLDWTDVPTATQYRIYESASVDEPATAVGVTDLPPYFFQAANDSVEHHFYYVIAERP